jgi:aldose sugar dehydrogenase
MKKNYVLLLVFSLVSFYTFSQTNQIQLDSTILEYRIVADSLEIPWDLDMDKDGRLWFNEKKGTIKTLNVLTGQVDSIYKISDVYQSYDNSGFHAMALHPNFPNEPYIYAHYSFSLTNSRLIRLQYNPTLNSIVSSSILLDWMCASHTHIGSRIVFSPEKDKMFLSFGDCNYSDLVQDTSLYIGRILRINLDGSVPDDNPFGNTNHSWTLGNRNPQGLVFGNNGILYSSEHGASTDDEINIIEKGRNYGWVDVEGYCDTEAEIQVCNDKNIKEPIYAWTPTVAPSGIAYFDHESIPEWRHSLIVALLKNRRLRVLKLNADGDSILSDSSYFVNMFGRIRDVFVAKNGKLYMVTSNQEANGAAFIQEGDDKIIEIYNPNYAYPLNPEKEKTTFSDSVLIYPNPNNANFNIFVQLRDSLQFQVINLIGRVMLEGELRLGNNTFNYENVLQRGSYILKINDKRGNVLSIKKLIIN